MADKITTFHPETTPTDNLYPNIVSGNIPSHAITSDKLDTTLQTDKTWVESIKDKVTQSDDTTEIDGKLQVNDDVDLMKDIAITGNEIVTGTTTLHGAVSTNSTLEVDGSCGLHGDLIIPSATNFKDTNGNQILQLSNIVDNYGNNRFVEGSVTLNVSGLTQDYGKWSLSGTHLMIVLAFTIPANYSLSNTLKADLTLPDFIANKIYILGRANAVTMTSGVGFSDNYTWTGTISNVYLFKLNNNSFYIGNESYLPTGATYDKHFRVQIDLLIDSD